MAIDSEVVELEFDDVVANVSIPCDMKVYTEEVVYVYYNLARTLAVVDIDYTIALNEDTHEDFTITPTTALLVKINAAINVDPDEENKLYVKRTLPFTTDFQETDSFLRDKLATEFDRTIMMMQQLKYEFDLIAALPTSVAAAEAAAAAAAASAAEAEQTIADGIAEIEVLVQLASEGKLLLLDHEPLPGEGVDGNMAVWDDNDHLPVYTKASGVWTMRGYFIGFDGEDGAGAGDMVSDESPTVIGRVLVWNSTNKHVASITLQSIYDAVGNVRDTDTNSVIGRVLTYDDVNHNVTGKEFAALLAGEVFAPYSNVTLAGTSNISASNTIAVAITAGTGPITSFGTTKDKYLRIVKADVAFSITRNATNLETPNGQDISVGIGDILLVLRDSARSAAKTQVLQVIKADGRAYRGPNDIPENLSYSGIISPTQISANVNDYAPTGAQTAASWRINTDASRNITGIIAPTSGRAEKRIIRNVGSFPAVLINESASSSSANRMTLGADVTLAPGKAVILLYDVTTSRWGIISNVLPFGALAILDRIVGVDQNFAVSGVLTPAQITSNQNDYSPANLATNSVLRLDTDASRNITGLLATATADIKFVINKGNNNIVLKNADAGSTAANRFDFGGDRTLAAGDGLILWYDLTSARWRALSPVPAAGGGGSGTTHWGVCDGRLSYATGVYDFGAAVSAATSIFWTVTRGGQIGLYDGVSAWTLIASGEKSIKLTDAQTGTTNTSNGQVIGLTDTSQLAVGMKGSGTGIGVAAVISTIDSATQVTMSVTGTANGSNTITFKCPADTGYDVYAKNVAGANKLFMKVRASILTKNTHVIQDGVEVLSGDTTKRWLGCFITSATDGQFDWALAGQRRFRIYNHYNRRTVFNCEAFAASGTWYKALGLISLKMEVRGGGGGGGSAVTGSPGTAGGTSSFGSHASATGGARGDAVTISADAGASSGDVNILGGGGAAGWNSAAPTYSGEFGNRGGWSVRTRFAADLGATETVTVGGAGAAATGAKAGVAGLVLAEEMVEV